VLPADPALIVFKERLPTTTDDVGHPRSFCVRAGPLGKEPQTCRCFRSRDRGVPFKNHARQRKRAALFLTGYPTQTGWGLHLFMNAIP
jgi:hypothetical protein